MFGEGFAILAGATTENRQSLQLLGKEIYDSTMNRICSNFDSELLALQPPFWYTVKDGTFGTSEEYVSLDDFVTYLNNIYTDSREEAKKITICRTTYKKQNLMNYKAAFGTVEEIMQNPESIHLVLTEMLEEKGCF